MFVCLFFPFSFFSVFCLFNKTNSIKLLELNFSLSYSLIFEENIFIFFFLIFFSDICFGLVKALARFQTMYTCEG